MKNFKVTSEFEFASVATINAAIAAIESYRALGRGVPPAMQTKYDMLRFQWLGNAMIREEGSL